MGGDKSGIWRFYRRVWKNIFYEGGVRREKEGFGRRRGKRKGERVGEILGWVWKGITYTIYSNKSELKICKLAYFISEIHKSDSNKKRGIKQ